MSFEGIDEWDENFLDEAIRIELHALSTRSTQNPNPNPSSTVPLDFPPIPPLAADQSRVSSSHFLDAGTIDNFSPPRELSQRVVVDSGVDCEIVPPPVVVGRNGRYGGIKKEKDKEVDRLKRELTRVSKQLNQLEHECVELKKDRAKKDEQLRGALSQIEAKDAEIKSLKRDDDKLDVQNRIHSNQGGHNQGDQKVHSRHSPQGLQDASNIGSSKPRIIDESSSSFCRDPALFQYAKGDNMQTDSPGVIAELNDRVLPHSNLATSTGPIVKDNTLPMKSSRLKSTKTTGTQTEFSQDCLHVSPVDLADEHIANKLLSVWGFPYNKGTGKNMVSKLLASCSEDFCGLFRCMHAPSNMKGLKHEDTIFSATAMPNEMQSTLSAVSSKVALVYTKFTKMQNGTMNLQDFVEGLLDICTLENDFVVQKSLHILHVIVQHTMSCNTRSSRSVPWSGMSRSMNMRAMCMKKGISLLEI